MRNQPRTVGVSYYVASTYIMTGNFPYFSQLFTYFISFDYRMEFPDSTEHGLKGLNRLYGLYVDITVVYYLNRPRDTTPRGNIRT